MNLMRGVISSSWLRSSSVGSLLGLAHTSALGISGLQNKYLSILLLDYRRRVHMSSRQFCLLSLEINTIPHTLNSPCLGASTFEFLKQTKRDGVSMWREITATCGLSAPVPQRCISFFWDLVQGGKNSDW